MFIPLEAIHIFEKNNKSVNYVYLFENGKISKKEVKVGLVNDESVIIEGGLTKKDQILLNKPTGEDELYEFVALKKKK